MSTHVFIFDYFLNKTCYSTKEVGFFRDMIGCIYFYTIIEIGITIMLWIVIYYYIAWIIISKNISYHIDNEIFK